MPRIAIMVVMALCCLALPARAQDSGSAEALAAAKELSAIITGDTIKQMSAAVTAQVWPPIEREFSSKVDAATLAEMRSEFEQALAEFTGGIQKDAPALYAKYFTASELRDMLAFYKSPTGAKTLRVLPSLTGEIMALVGPRAAAFQQEIVTRMRAVMKKHGYDK